MRSGLIVKSIYKVAFEQMKFEAPKPPRFGTVERRYVMDNVPLRHIKGHVSFVMLNYATCEIPEALYAICISYLILVKYTTVARELHPQNVHTGKMHAVGPYRTNARIEQNICLHST